MVWSVTAKTCRRCGEEKPLTEFYKNPSAADGYRNHCKACPSAGRADWFRANKDRLSELQKARRSEGRAFLSEQKRKPCMDCGGFWPDNPEVMDFDHRPGEVKLFNPGMGNTGSRERMLAEIAKCDLVCANCHRIRTAARGYRPDLTNQRR